MLLSESVVVVATIAADAGGAVANAAVAAVATSDATSRTARARCRLTRDAADIDLTLRIGPLWIQIQDRSHTESSPSGPAT